MKFTCTVQQEDGEFVASCLEVDMEADGATEQAAVESLRAALGERMNETEAMAPPSRTSITPVELVVVSSGAHA